MSLWTNLVHTDALALYNATYQGHFDIREWYMRTTEETPPDEAIESVLGKRDRAPEIEVVAYQHGDEIIGDTDGAVQVTVDEDWINTHGAEHEVDEDKITVVVGDIVWVVSA